MKRNFRKTAVMLTALLMSISHMSLQIAAKEDTQAQVIEEEPQMTEALEEAESEAITEETEIAEEPEITEEAAEADTAAPETEAADQWLTVFSLDPVGNGTVRTDAVDFSSVADTENGVLSTGLYAVTASRTMKNRITVNGDVEIILCDGAALTMEEGIHNGEGNALTIRAQSAGAAMGRLICTADGDKAAIGGNEKENGGTLKIYGGDITAAGDDCGAGIGGGTCGNGGTIEIYGGKIHAEGGHYWNCAGAGIGGGDEGNGGNISIYGGDIYATATLWGAAIGGGNCGGSGNILVAGGKIEALGGKHAAGIGGGDKASGEEIHITGGDIRATGGEEWSAGIGGGNKGHGGHIVIDGGHIFAKSYGGGAGIGGGDNGNSGIIEINRGAIEAHGTMAIGAGRNGAHQSLTLAPRMIVEGFPYEKRYEVLSYGHDVFLSETEDYPVKDPVTFLDENGKPITISEYTDICELIDQNHTIWQEGWYAVTADRDFSLRPSLVGNVKLILCDGITLNMSHGLRAELGVGNLTIYAQSTDSEKAGKLICGAYDDQAGIGGNDGKKAGTITICGGNIEAHGGANGAGIGGGCNADGGDIIIRGGNISAYGGNGWKGAGAGIGGGNHGSGGEITISDGTVYAEGANWGAGIGGGNCGSGGSIRIEGGNVSAKGNKGGAGIGGGDSGKGGSITITGGSVYAVSPFIDGWFDDDQGAGIGAGNNADGGSISILGGHTEAHGWEAFGKGNDGKNSGSLYLAPAIYAESSGTIHPYEKRYELARTHDMVLFAKD